METIMELNKEIKKTYHFVDEYGMMRANTKDPNKGMGDSIGRSFDAYMAYGDESFVDAIQKCYYMDIDKNKKLYVHGYRHPSLIQWHNSEEFYNDLSRDHVIYTLLALKASGRDLDLKEYARLNKWRISERYTFTPDSWLWMKGLAGNKWATAGWYAIAIPFTAASLVWNSIIRLIVGKGFDEVHQDEYDVNDKPTAKERWWRKLRYPEYALHQTTWQSYAMQPTFANKVLKKLLWGISGKYNYLNKLLTGHKVTEEEVLGYKPMTSSRWTTRLDKTNDRDLRIITKEIDLKYNVLDETVLRNIYSGMRNHL